MSVLYVKSYTRENTASQGQLDMHSQRQSDNRMTSYHGHESRPAKTAAVYGTHATWTRVTNKTSDKHG